MFSVDAVDGLYPYFPCLTFLGIKRFTCTEWYRWLGLHRKNHKFLVCILARFWVNTSCSTSCSALSSVLDLHINWNKGMEIPWTKVLGMLGVRNVQKSSAEVKQNADPIHSNMFYEVLSKVYLITICFRLLRVTGERHWSNHHQSWCWRWNKLT